MSMKNIGAFTFTNTLKKSIANSEGHTEKEKRVTPVHLMLRCWTDSSWRTDGQTFLQNKNNRVFTLTELLWAMCTHLKLSWPPAASPLCSRPVAAVWPSPSYSLILPEMRGIRWGYRFVLFFCYSLTWLIKFKGLIKQHYAGFLFHISNRALCTLWSSSTYDAANICHVLSISVAPSSLVLRKMCC